MKHSIVIFLLVLAAFLFMDQDGRAQSHGLSDTSRVDSFKKTGLRLDTITTPNSIYIELLGAGIGYTVNYDRMLSNNTSIRFGFGTFTLSVLGSASLTAVPVTISWFPFSNESSAPSSKLEIGAGFDFMTCTVTPLTFFGPPAPAQSASSVCLTGIVGYRYQSSNGGFFFRIAFTPILFTDNNLQALVIGGGSSIQPYGGISFGGTF
jgi:hypothetical protein